MGRPTLYHVPSIIDSAAELSHWLIVLQKAEGTFKAWNALIQKERDHKYRVLQQRVRIQRELIGKKDQVLQDIRTKAEEERLEVCVRARWCLWWFANNGLLFLCRKFSS